MCHGAAVLFAQILDEVTFNEIFYFPLQKKIQSRKVGATSRTQLTWNCGNCMCINPELHIICVLRPHKTFFLKYTHTHTQELSHFSRGSTRKPVGRWAPVTFIHFEVPCAESRRHGEKYTYMGNKTLAHEQCKLQESLLGASNKSRGKVIGTEGSFPTFDATLLRNKTRGWNNAKSSARCIMQKHRGWVLIGTNTSFQYVGGVIWLCILNCVFVLQQSILNSAFDRIFLTSANFKVFL